MQETVLNGKLANEYVMADRDKITKMSPAIKEKYGSEFVEGRDYHTSQLGMVYFMQPEEGPPAVGLVLQESFPIDPSYKVSSKRKVESKEETVVVEESK